MKTLYLILYVIAVTCFAAAGLLGETTVGPLRVRLIALGLLAAVLVPLVELTQVTT